ncbi:hypothetical protein ColLi_11450 [Colletotrichum liriopes]|uniref:Uncharacterized protein n=1 Tax=Colletotrichum liriopes TaxID=708192 RepID=A0AA37GX21_9PEZI|nr:hypothetical protein ColLi_11450 [Colletotrichum liriopes]
MKAWQHAVGQVLADKAALLKAKLGIIAVHEQLQALIKCPRAGAPRGTDVEKAAVLGQVNATLQGAVEIPRCEDEPEPEPGPSDGQLAFHAQSRRRGGKQKKQDTK